MARRKLLPKNNLVKVGKISAPKNERLSDHIYHAIDHNFTTKTPARKRTFPKTTLKNASKAAHSDRGHAEQFFPEN
jgi:hypothetical protein